MTMEGDYLLLYAERRLRISTRRLELDN